MAGAAGYLFKEIRGSSLVDAIRSVAAGLSLLDPKVTGRLLERLWNGEPKDRRLAELIERERGVLLLITEGLTNRQIGVRLFLAEKTVKNYVSALLGKLGMERRTQLAALGAELRRGDLDAAQTALDRISFNADEKVQFRLCALGADILRDRGQFAEAASRYDQLLADYAGTSREGVLRQHLGKVHFAARNYRAAQKYFAETLQLRRAQGADADLIETSIIALKRADEEANRLGTNIRIRCRIRNTHRRHRYAWIWCGYPHVAY